jgi:hypothetical protein
MVQISIVSVELKMCHRIICIGISTQYAHNNWPLWVGTSLVPRSWVLRTGKHWTLISEWLWRALCIIPIFPSVTVNLSEDSQGKLEWLGKFEAYRVHFIVFFNSVLNRKKTDCQHVEKQWKSWLGTGNIVVNKFAVEGGQSESMLWLVK